MSSVCPVRDRRWTAPPHSPEPWCPRNLRAPLVRRDSTYREARRVAVAPGSAAQRRGRRRRWT
eukprot:5168074-Alexandrium_andersonii.AAC.1